MQVEQFFLVFSVTLRGGATAPLELWIQLARSEGRFGTLGLELVALPVVRALSCVWADEPWFESRGTLRNSAWARMFRGTFRNSGTRAQRIFGKAGDARAWLDTPQPARSTDVRRVGPKCSGPSLHERTGRTRNSAVRAAAGVTPLGLGGECFPLP